MNAIKLTIIFLLISYSSFCQICTDTTFYSSKYREPARNCKSAKYIEYSILNPDSSIIYEFRKKRKNKLIESKTYKNGVPFGIWDFDNGDFVDYDFNLVYCDSSSQDSLQYILSEINKSKDYGSVPPLYRDQVDGFSKHIMTNLYYPEYAREYGLQGKVYISFVIDKEGNMKDVCVIRGVNPHLDVEAVRVVRLAKKWSPAILKGEAIEISLVIPINFRLG